MSHINHLLSKLAHNKNYYVGYPTATDFNNDNSAALLNQHMNNIGDPFNSGSSYSTFPHEKEVIKFFMKLYHVTPDSAWGYVASCSTEAMLYVCWRYRECASNDVVLIASDNAHYANQKIASLLNIPYRVIASNVDGSVNVDKLQGFVSTNRDKSFIFVATMGTTMTSAVDDVAAVKNAFELEQVEHFIHLDGAFDGAFLPLIEQYQLGAHFTSVNISGHKFLGSPMPSGVLLMSEEYVGGQYVEYINNDDVTIGGSRNGLAPVLIYNAIKNIGAEQGMRLKYQACLTKAEHFLQKLQQHAIACWKNEKAITIVLEDVPDPLFLKWHLPRQGNRATLTCLPKFTDIMLDELIVDLLSPDAICFDNVKRFDYYVEPL